MPRHASENTTAFTIKMPEEWLERAQKLAAATNRHGVLGTAIMGHVTQTDVLRAAIETGLEQLEEAARRHKGK